MSEKSDNLARFLSLIAIVVSGITAYMTYKANEAAYTHQIKSEFAQNLPDSSKRCLAYFHEMNGSTAKFAVQGKPHKIESQSQLENFQICLPYKSKGLAVGSEVSLGQASDIKNKAKKALRTLEHAAAELENADACALAQELNGVMGWPEVVGAVEKFRNFGVTQDSNMFGAIKHFQSTLKTDKGLTHVCG